MNYYTKNLILYSVKIDIKLPISFKIDERLWISKSILDIRKSYNLVIGQLIIYRSTTTFFSTSFTSRY